MRTMPTYLFSWRFPENILKLPKTIQADNDPNWVDTPKTEWPLYYDLSSKLSKRYTLVLSNIRESDKVPKYQLSILYTNYCWFMLHFFNPTLMTIYSP